MRCPFCSSEKNKVIDSRSTENGRAIRRRRHCNKCGRRFTTYEYIESTAKFTVIKRDGTRVPYDRQKLLRGLQAACYKRDVTPVALQRIAEEVEEELSQRYEKEILSVEIGRAVAERLRQVDRVAYVRFASVYKNFRDAEDFIDEVRESFVDRPTPSQGQQDLF